jgi:hypothetical protein
MICIINTNLICREDNPMNNTTKKYTLIDNIFNFYVNSYVNCMYIMTWSYKTAVARMNTS